MAYVGDKKRQYQLEWLRKRRNKWLKENGPCVNCGSEENLEVDHIDPTTKDPKLKISESSLWSWSNIRREAELAKCQVLCHDCHVKKTVELDISKPYHGSGGMWRRGCRCELCREYARLSKAKWRAKTKELAVA